MDVAPYKHRLLRLVLDAVPRPTSSLIACWTAKLARLVQDVRRTPPDIPGREVAVPPGPGSTTRPPVMYSHPWSPIALDDGRAAPLLRTAEPLAGNAPR